MLALGGHGTIVAAVAWQGGGVGGVVLWAGVAATFFGLVLLVSVRLASRELSSADDIAWFRRGAVGLVAIGSTVMGLGFLLGGRFL